MLGIRLSEDAEKRLARHASEIGRPKSVIARDWIMERLEREEVDDMMRFAAGLHAGDTSDVRRRLELEASDAFSRWLDEEDGGYDWGPEGPPVAA